MFQITVQKLTQTEESKYPNKEEIYTQIVEDVDIVAIINAVNKKD